MNKRIRVIGLMLIIWGLSYLGFAAYQLNTPLQTPSALLVSLEKAAHFLVFLPS
jgi:hypothetical protein